MASFVKFGRAVGFDNSYVYTSRRPLLKFFCQNLDFSNIGYPLIALV